MECWFSGEGVTGGVRGELIEHVDNIKEEEGTGGGFAGVDGFGNEVVELSGGQMGHEINAAADGNTKLANREQEGGEIIGKNGGDEGADYAAPCCSNSNGAEFCKVVRVFVEG